MRIVRLQQQRIAIDRECDAAFGLTVHSFGIGIGIGIGAVRAGPPYVKRASMRRLPISFAQRAPMSLRHT